MNLYCIFRSVFLKKQILVLSAIVTVILIFLTCQRINEPADLVLRNGRIVTVDGQSPQVSALAIKGDRINAVRNDRDMLRFTGRKTQVIDLKGMLAIPGFIEGHGHFYSVSYTHLTLPTILLV